MSEKNLKEPNKKVEKFDGPALELAFATLFTDMKVIAKSELSASGSMQVATRSLAQAKEFLSADSKLAEKFLS